MRIAVIAPVIRKITNESGYGGIERIIKSLVIGSCEAGHKVTLYAPSGTDLEHNNLKVVETTDTDISKDQNLIKLHENKLFTRIITEQNQFDLIHSHIEPIVAKNNSKNFFEEITTPTVITFHNQTYINDNIEYYKNSPSLDKLNFVFISNNQAKPLNFLSKQSVIYNGISLSDLEYNDKPIKDQLAFLGRIIPEKGITEAIKIARSSKKHLLIGANIDKSQISFFEEQVKPNIDNEQIIYLGEVFKKEKNDLLKNSEALLFPIQWHEPFGLVIVESLATGTPVIAPNIGSVSEIIQDGVNGYIVSDPKNIDEYVEKINNISTINRLTCRKSIENRFVEKIMIENYLKLYDSIASKS